MAGLWLKPTYILIAKMNNREIILLPERNYGIYVLEMMTSPSIFFCLCGPESPWLISQMIRHHFKY